LPVTVAVIIFVIAVVSTLYLLKKGVNLGLIMILDAVFVVILSGIAPLDGLRYALNGLVSDKTFKLIIMIYFIMLLERIMRKTGMIKSMVESLKQLVGNNRLAAALLPLTVGLLPSPAGARFSCPMVDDVVKDNSDNFNKAFVNYWFRHIWTDGFLLYPGIIFVSELLEIPILTFFIRLLPFMVLRIVLGTVFGLRHIKKEYVEHTRSRKENLKLFSVSVFPAIGVILIYMALLNYTPYSLEAALIFMTFFLFIFKGYDIKKIVKTMKEDFPLKFTVIIVGVMIFKYVLEGSKVLDMIPEFTERASIPVEALFMVLPYIGGFASGIAVSFVSITFPILMPLGLVDSLWYAAFAFEAGFAGVMTTPLHLCAAATSDYFKIPLGKLLSKSALVESIMIVVIIALFLFFK
jgi:uncharacterized protein